MDVADLWGTAIRLYWRLVIKQSDKKKKYSFTNFKISSNPQSCRLFKKCPVSKIEKFFFVILKVLWHPSYFTVQDASRLYYNKSELQQFEDIECEWPIFFCYLILDAMYSKNDDAVEHYWQQLEKVLVLSDKGFRLVPELYVVMREHVGAEKAHPGSQDRLPGGATWVFLLIFTWNWQNNLFQPVPVGPIAVCYNLSSVRRILVTGWVGPPFPPPISLWETSSVWSSSHCARRVDRCSERAQSSRYSCSGRWCLQNLHFYVVT